MADKQIKVIITADGKQYALAIDKATGETRKLGNAVDDSNTKTGKWNTSFLSLRSTIATLGLGILAREVIQYADTWTRVNNQLLVNVESTAAFNLAQQDIIDIALRTRSALESVASLYGRMSAAAVELGATQAQIAQLTELSAQAIAVQGSSVGEASGALLQLSQLLGGSVVQAQEFNSLIDGARPLLVAVANGSDRFGGSVAKLREEVRNGTVTSKEFFDAALAGSEIIATKFEKARRSISQGGEVFQTGLTVGIGTLNEFLGSSDGMVDGLTAASGMMIDFAKALTGGLSPTQELSARMKVLAGGTILLGSGLNIVGDVIWNSLVTPFQVAGETLGGFAASLVLFAKGDFKGAVQAFGSPLHALDNAFERTGKQMEETTRESNAAWDNFRELFDKTARDIQDTSAETAAEIDKIADALNTDKIQEQIDKITASLQDQAATYGMTRGEIELYRLELLNASDAEKTFAEEQIEVLEILQEVEAAAKAQTTELNKRKDELEKNKEADQALTDGLAEQIKMLHMSGRELAIYTALQKLSADAGEDQIDATARLAAALYDQQVAMDTLEKEGKDAMDTLTNAVQGMGREFTDTFVDMVTTGKASFGDLVDSMIRDLARLAIQKSITDPLFGALSGVLGGGGGGGGIGSWLSALLNAGTGSVGGSTMGMLGSGQTFAAVAHTGGIAGHLTQHRAVPSAVFDHAPRYHQGKMPGLSDGEMPAIIRRDEGVFTPEQMQALGGQQTVININVDARGADAGVEQKVRQIARDEIYPQTMAAVRSVMQNYKPRAKIF